MFRLKVNKNIIHILEKETLTTDSVNVYHVLFDFNEDWDGLKRTAVFESAGVSKSVILDDTNTCTIPWEVLKKHGEYLSVGVYGSNGKDVVLPTIWAVLNKIKKGTTPSEIGQDPTPDVYDQMIEIMEETEKIAQSVREDADNGVFDGYSPEVTLKEESDGILISVKNKDGEETAKVKNGKDYEHSKEFSQLANQIRSDKLAVDKTKETIDQTASDFLQLAGKAVNDVSDAGVKAVKDIQSAGSEEVGKVTSAGQKAVEDVNAQKDAAIDAIEGTGAENVQKVSDEGTKQVQAVEAAAEEIIEDRDQIQKNKEDISKFMIRQSATSDCINIYGSADHPVQALKIYGKSLQESTTGAQLLNLPEKSVNIYGVDVVYKDAVVDFNGVFNNDDNNFRTSIKLEDVKEQLEVGKQYTLATDNKRILCDFHIVTENEGFYVTKFPYLVTGEELSISPRFFHSTTTNGTAIKDYAHVILYEGSGEKSWELYTGGEPSPSPDYPQEIVSAGDGGGIKVSTTGGNLYDISTIPLKGQMGVGKYIREEDVLTITGIGTGDKECTMTYDIYLEDGTYTLSFETDGKLGTKPGEDTVEMYIIGHSKKNNVMTYIYATKENSHVTFDIRNDENEYRIRFDINKDDTTHKFYNVMVNAGSVPLPYESYKIQPLDILTPNGLCGIPVSSGGNYVDETGQQWIADSIEFYSDGTGKFVQRVKKFVFDGSEDETIKVESNTTIGNRYSIRLDVSVKISDLRNGVTSMNSNLPIGNAGTTWTSTNLYTIYDADVNSGITLIFSLNGTEDLDEVREYLRQKPMTLLAALIDPIETPLTSEEIAAFKSLHANYPNTHITNDAGAWMEVEYVADTKMYIDKKFDEMAIQLINTQAQLLERKI